MPYYNLCPISTTGYTPAVRITTGIRSDDLTGAITSAVYSQCTFRDDSITPTGADTYGDWVNSTSYAPSWSVGTLPGSATWNFSIKATNNASSTQVLTIYVATGDMNGSSTTLTSWTLSLAGNATGTGTNTWVQSSPSSSTLYKVWAKVTTGTGTISLVAADAATYITITY